MHLDSQAGHDSASLPHKLHQRSALLDARHQMLVRIVAVPLRPEADSPALTGLRERGFPGQEPYDVFRYQVLRVWQVPPELLLRGLGTLPLAPIGAVTEADLPGIITAMDRRLSGRRWRRRAEEIWSATYLLMGLRWPRDVTQVLLRGVRSMRESVTYQAILEEGREEGKEMGKAEGALAEAKKLLRLLGESRFGRLDAHTA